MCPAAISAHKYRAVVGVVALGYSEFVGVSRPAQACSCCIERSARGADGIGIKSKAAAHAPCAAASLPKCQRDGVVRMPGHSKNRRFYLEPIRADFHYIVFRQPQLA